MKKFVTNIIVLREETQMTTEEKIRLNIRDLSHDGRGIARLNDYTLFIPGALPGEEILATITSRKKRYGEARLLKIYSQSEKRQTPSCPVFHQCGGCQLQHMNYQSQLEFKQSRVLQALKRIAKLSQVPPIKVHPTEPWYYRNKGTYHCHTNGKLGFFAPESHQVVPHQECLIMHRHANSYKKELEENNIPSPGERCILRTSTLEKEGIAVLERKKPLKKLKELSLKGVYIQKNNHLCGGKKLTEKMGPLTFQIPPGVFFQVHDQGREILLQRAAELLNPAQQDTLLDLYCGVGALSLPHGKTVREILGLDSDREAIQVAEEHAQKWGYTNTTFLHQRAEKKGSCSLLEKEPTVALLDPPREGCARILLKKLLNSSLQRIVYISCDPATMARDIKQLRDGFQVKGLELVDMFPQTYHVEALAVLQRE